MIRVKKHIAFGLALLLCLLSEAQDISINTTGNSGHASAILDLTTTEKGVLFPRMTSAQRQAIPSPATGLYVFDTDENDLMIYNGSEWLRANKLSSTWTDSNTFTYLTPTGNVGIGVSNPAAKLDVQGDLQLSRTSSDNALINLGDGNSTPKWQIVTESSGTYNYQGHLVFKSKQGDLWNDPLVEQLRLTHTGYLGIGGTPAYHLDVYGSGNINSLRVHDRNTGGHLQLTSTGSGEAYVYLAGENSSLQRAHSHLSLYGNAIPIRFSTSNGSGQALYIDTTNKVGMGNLSPNLGQLSVEQNGTGEQNVLAIGNTNGAVNSEANIIFYQNQSSQALGKLGAYVTANSPYDTDLRFSTVNNGNWTEDALVITSDGNVGIGTTDPEATALLEVRSTSQGFSPPSLTTAQRDAIASPVLALTIYNSDLECMQYYTGVGWFSFGCR